MTNHGLLKRVGLIAAGMTLIACVALTVAYLIVPMRVRYDMAMRSARERIPLIDEFRLVYPSAQEFITSYGATSVPQEWHSVVMVADRFRLTMTVPLSIGRLGTSARASASPRFSALEITARKRLPDGRILEESAGWQKVFGVREWGELLARNGDLRAIGAPIEQQHGGIE